MKKKPELKRSEAPFKMLADFVSPKSFTLRRGKHTAGKKRIKDAIVRASDLLSAPLFFDTRIHPHLLHLALNPGFKSETFCRRSQLRHILISLDFVFFLFR